VRDCKHLITRQIQGKPKFFLDADIKGCFDNISHEALLKKIDTMPMFEKQIKA
jgi:RNA-directed DNA polymerase